MKDIIINVLICISILTLIGMALSAMLSGRRHSKKLDTMKKDADAKRERQARIR